MGTMNVPGFLEDALHQGICEVAAQEDVVRLDRDLEPLLSPLRLGGREVRKTSGGMAAHMPRRAAGSERRLSAPVWKRGSSLTVVPKAPGVGSCPMVAIKQSTCTQQARTLKHKPQPFAHEL